MSNNAEHCKICGLRLYNYCLGETKTDPNGNHPDWLEHHKNDSDARFCEKCGEHTTYGTEGLLRTWEDVKSSHDLTLDYDPVNDTIPF